MKLKLSKKAFLSDSFFLMWKKVAFLHRQHHFPVFFLAWQHFPPRYQHGNSTNMMWSIFFLLQFLISREIKLHFLMLQYSQSVLFRLMGKSNTNWIIKTFFKKNTHKKKNYKKCFWRSFMNYCHEGDKSFWTFKFSKLNFAPLKKGWTKNRTECIGVLETL